MQRRTKAEKTLANYILDDPIVYEHIPILRIIDIVSSVSEFIDLSTGEFKNPFTFNYLLALKGVHNMKMYMNSITSKNTRSEQMKYDYYFAHAKNAKTMKMSNVTLLYEIHAMELRISNDSTGKAEKIQARLDFCQKYQFLLFDIYAQLMAEFEASYTGKNQAPFYMIDYFKELEKQNQTPYVELNKMVTVLNLDNIKNNTEVFPDEIYAIQNEYLNTNVAAVPVHHLRCCETSLLEKASYKITQANRSIARGLHRTIVGNVAPADKDVCNEYNDDKNIGSYTGTGKGKDSDDDDDGLHGIDFFKSDLEYLPAMQKYLDNKIPPEIVVADETLLSKMKDHYKGLFKEITTANDLFSINRLRGNMEQNELNYVYKNFQQKIATSFSTSLILDAMFKGNINETLSFINYVIGCFKQLLTSDQMYSKVSFFYRDRSNSKLSSIYNRLFKPFNTKEQWVKHIEEHVRVVPKGGNIIIALYDRFKRMMQQLYTPDVYSDFVTNLDNFYSAGKMNQLSDMDFQIFFDDDTFPLELKKVVCEHLITNIMVMLTTHAIPSIYKSPQSYSNVRITKITASRSPVTFVAGQGKTKLVFTKEPGINNEYYIIINESLLDINIDTCQKYQEFGDKLIKLHGAGFALYRVKLKLNYSKFTSWPRNPSSPFIQSVTRSSRSDKSTGISIRNHYNREMTHANNATELLEILKRYFSETREGRVSSLDEIFDEYNNIISNEYFSKTMKSALLAHTSKVNLAKRFTPSTGSLIQRGSGKTTRKRQKVKISNKRSVPCNYVPQQLSKKDKKQQIRSILNKRDRPRLKTFKSVKSQWIKKFENKYNQKITNKNWIHKNLLKNTGQRNIMKKGMGAYYSSGSRPNQTKHSWAYARLASVLMNGPARNVDKKIWNTYKI